MEKIVKTIKDFGNKKTAIMILGVALGVTSILLQTIDLILEPNQELISQVIGVLFIITYNIAIVLCVLCLIIFIVRVVIKGERDIYLFIIGITSIASLILLLRAYAILNLLWASLGGDYKEILRLARSSDLEGKSKLLTSAIFINFWIGINSLAFYKRTKKTNTVNLAVDKEIVYGENFSEVNTSIKETTNDINNVLEETTNDINNLTNSSDISTMTKSVLNDTIRIVKTKNAKLIIGIVAIVVIAISVFYFVGTTLTKTEISMTGNVELTFTGEDEEGFIDNKTESYDDIEYDRTSEEQTRFVQTVYFKTFPNTNLKNGEKVKLIAEYDEDMAKKYNIKVTDTDKEFEVKGLTVIYKSGKEIPSNIVALVVKDGEDTLLDNSKNISKYSLDKLKTAKDIKILKTELISKQYGIKNINSPSKYSDDLVCLFKVYISGDIDGKTVTEEIFAYTSSSAVTSDYKSGQKSGGMFMVDSDYKVITKQGEALKFIDDYMNEKYSVFDIVK